jgi:hypothetical protein
VVVDRCHQVPGPPVGAQDAAQCLTVHSRAR